MTAPDRSRTPDRQCPELDAPCDKRYSCEHTKRGKVIICMRANVRRWINEEPPFGTNKPEKRP
jgi:hypothetical protein